MPLNPKTPSSLGSKIVSLEGVREGSDVAPLNPEILAAFGLQGQAVTLIARRENLVYRVGNWALRVHRPGYRTADQIQAELTFITTLRAGGCAVPDAGQIHEIDGIIYSTVSWLSGQTFASLDPVPLEAYAQVGALLKKCQSVALPTLNRPLWDVEAILGDQPLWGRWQDYAGLTEGQLALFKSLQPRSALPPLQLIHADALRENILLVGQQPYLIDFDDCAYAYPSFDVATLLVKEWDRPDFAALKAAVLAGYGPINPEELSFMMALRALTYLGWVQDRSHEPGVADRAPQVVARAEHFARLYQEGSYAKTA